MPANRGESLKKYGLIGALLILNLLFGGLSAGARAQPPAEKAYTEAKADYNRFMADAKLWGQRLRWEKHIKVFDQIARLYPRSKRADDALFLAAGLYFSLYNYSARNSDLQQAARRYQALINSYPDSRLADDALFNLGNIFFKLKDQVQARKYWQRLLEARYARARGRRIEQFVGR